MCIHPALFASLIVEYKPVEASGDYYNAWGFEEGVANKKCMICFVVCSVV